MTINVENVKFLKTVMQTDRVDLAGFCSSMKKLEDCDFCGLKAIMGRKDEVEVDSSITRQMSYFERKNMVQGAGKKE